MIELRQYDDFLYNIKMDLLTKSIDQKDAKKDIEILDNLKEDILKMEYMYDRLFNICFAQYSSIEDFEKAKKEFLDE